MNDPGEQDAAHLREAADELERLRAALEKLVQTSLTAYHESEAAIAAASPQLTADMPVAAFFGTCRPTEPARHGGSRAGVRARDRGRPVPTDHRPGRHLISALLYKLT
jgi:hypothetical protein